MRERKKKCGKEKISLLKQKYQGSENKIQRAKERYYRDPQSRK